MSSIDHNETDVSGRVFVVIKKDDGEMHRFVVEPGADVAAAVAAMNEPLAELGCTPLSLADLSAVKTAIENVQTPEVIAAFALEAERRLITTTTRLAAMENK